MERTSYECDNGCGTTTTNLTTAEGEWIKLAISLPHYLDVGHFHLCVGCQAREIEADTTLGRFLKKSRGGREWRMLTRRHGDRRGFPSEAKPPKTRAFATEPIRRT